MIQTPIYNRRDCFALCASSQVLGLIPRNKNTSLDDRLMQTILTASNRPAPSASFYAPILNIRPMVTAGGIKATATMTPTSTLDVPLTNESDAAAPDASAMAVPE